MIWTSCTKGAELIGLLWSAIDVVRAGLRVLQETESKLTEIALKLLDQQSDQYENFEERSIHHNTWYLLVQTKLGNYNEDTHGNAH